MIESFDTESVKSIAGLIQLTIAPVFMIAGIAGFLNVFTGRLARIIDRLEKINKIHEEGKDIPEHVLRRKDSLLKRMKNTNRAILLMSTTALLIAIVMVTMFSSAIFGFQDSTLIILLYLTAMVTFIISLTLFCKEILVTVSSAEIRSEFLP